MDETDAKVVNSQSLVPSLPRNPSDDTLGWVD